MIQDSPLRLVAHPMLHFLQHGIFQWQQDSERNLFTLLYKRRYIHWLNRLTLPSEASRKMHWEGKTTANIAEDKIGLKNKKYNCHLQLIQENPQRESTY